MEYVNINGKTVPTERASIPVADRGFRFGDGVFETIALHDGVLYQWELHEQRLNEGLAALQIPLPSHDIPRLVRRVIRKNEIRDGFVRISISRGVGSKGYRPLPDSEPTLVIECLPFGAAKEPAVSLWLSRYCKPPKNSYPTAFKTAQGLNSTLAIMEAAAQGCDDALILSHDGQLCETASASLFWYQNGTLFTPALSTGCLRGTTREAVLRLSPYPVKHEAAWIEALQNAECVFITNCNLGIMPVSTLKPQGWQWKAYHTIIGELQSLYRLDIKRYVELHRQPA